MSAARLINFETEPKVSQREFNDANLRPVADSKSISRGRDREYSPDTGRFLSVDPAGVDADINPFRYVHANPFRYSDPNGLWAIQIGGQASGLFPTLGAGLESGVALSYSQESGLQYAGYQSAQGRAGLGIFGGLSIDIIVTPSAKSVSDLNGISAGGGVDTPWFGLSRQYEDIDARATPSTGVSIGPGAIGDVYGSVTYTRIGEPLTLIQGGGFCQNH